MKEQLLALQKYGNTFVPGDFDVICQEVAVMMMEEKIGFSVARCDGGARVYRTS